MIHEQCSMNIEWLNIKDFVKGNEAPSFEAWQEPLHKSFSFWISSVNVTKSAVSCEKQSTINLDNQLA